MTDKWRPFVDSSAIRAEQYESRAKLSLTNQGDDNYLIVAEVYGQMIHAARKRNREMAEHRYEEMKIHLTQALRTVTTLPAEWIRQFCVEHQ